MGVNKRLAGSGGGRGGRSEILAIRNRQFFDRPAVIAALETKQLRVMAKTGGFARTTMRRLFRKRKGASAPGKPPHRHPERFGGNKFYELTEFGYDASDQSLVCGPQLVSSPTLPLGGKTVPQLHNEGGDAFVNAIGGGRLLAHFPPRPFVAPTIDLVSEKCLALMQSEPFTFRGR